MRHVHALSSIIAIEGQFPQAIPTNRGQTTMGDVALEPNFNSYEEAYGVNRAYDPQTLEPQWEFNLVFGGGNDGYFVALDARSGELLWKASAADR